MYFNIGMYTYYCSGVPSCYKTLVFPSLTFADRKLSLTIIIILMCFNVVCIIIMVCLVVMKHLYWMASFRGLSMGSSLLSTMVSFNVVQCCMYYYSGMFSCYKTLALSDSWFTNRELSLTLYIYGKTKYVTRFCNTDQVVTFSILRNTDF